MAKMDEHPTLAARKAELKKQLKRLVSSIVEGEENFTLDMIERTKEALCALGDLKFETGSSWSFLYDVSLSCPDEFRCPLSKLLMSDPVILANGQTYDRASIQKWLNSGNRTCPQTHQVLSHTILTPNHLINEMIRKWCGKRGIEHAQQVNNDNDGVLGADRDLFLTLLNRMSSPSMSDHKSAARELRLLTKKMPSFRALFGESSSSISQLLSPLLESKSRSSSSNSDNIMMNSSSNRGGIHPELQEDLITTLLNLSIYDSNKKLVCETPMVIPLLIDAIKHGTVETRSNAAAALFTLSALDSNKAIIGRSGALGPLIYLLGDSHPLPMKDAASAIFNLCILHENKGRAVEEGAVSVLLSKIKSRVHVDELLAILAMLSSNQSAVEEMGELGAVTCLLEIINEGSVCSKSKENCIAILYVVCANDRTKLREMREDENVRGTISKLARVGTLRARRKANGILDKLNRAVNITHTA